MIYEDSKMSDDINVTFTNLSQLSHVYGAPAVDLAGRVLERTAQGQIYFGLFLCVVGPIIALIICLLTFLYYKKKEDYRSESLFVHFFAIGLFISCISVILGAIFLSDIWQWTALTDPKLALAHKIFGSMGG